jgi:carboxymethylenebutenolidase
VNVTDFTRYVIEEHVEDFNQGVINRRELLRRITLITGSAASTVALLQIMGCGTEPSGEPAAPAPRETSAQLSFATPPASPTTDGVTVPPDDPRIRVEPLAVSGLDGVALISYHARPAQADPIGGILVVHENRGMTAHIKDVVRRVATAGFSALAVDLLSRQGGADALTDPAGYAAELTKRPREAMHADLMRALSALSATGVGDRMGMTGFCFGGGMTWNAVAEGASLKAAVPFYGPAPANMAGLAATRTAVLGVYAERDSRITGGKEPVEAALRQSGSPHRVTVYPGVDHAFHNDTGQRYNAEQAEQAWVDAIGWFQQHVR